MEALCESFRMVKVDGCEGGEPHLSGQIASPKGVREEARMRLIKSEGCVKSPTIERTRGKGIGRGRTFQSMLHGSLSCIQALIDLDFVEKICDLRATPVGDPAAPSQSSSPEGKEIERQRGHAKPI